MTRLKRDVMIPMLAGIAAALLAVGAAALLKSGPHPPVVRVLIALMPIPAYGVLFWSILKSVRAMDEMQRRVQLEAAATALVGTTLATLTYGWLQKAGAPEINWAFVSIVILALYMIGYVNAARHYR